MVSREFTSIDQLMDGAVSERFRDELKKVSDNQHCAFQEPRVSESTPYVHRDHAA